MARLNFILAAATTVLTAQVTAAQLNPRASSAASISLAIPVQSTDTGFPIDSQFVGWTFESTSFNQFTGTPQNPNSFSQNLLQQIYDRTNTTPIIRVGGTSGDYSIYRTAQSTVVEKQAKAANGQALRTTVGPSFFESFKVFQNAEYILQLPFAEHNLTNIVDMAKEAFNVVGGARFVALELGNEANLYKLGPNAVRHKAWDPARYCGQWSAYTQAITKALKLPNDTAIWQALDFTALTVKGIRGLGVWQVNNTFARGLDRDVSRIKAVSLHYYQANSVSNLALQATLMNHTTTVRDLSYVIESNKFLQHNYSQLPFVIGEFGPVGGNHLKADTENPQYGGPTVGSTLWQIDFMLYTMSIGVRRVNFQQSINSHHLSWLPAPYGGKQPSVQPPYYSQLFVSEFIATNRSARIVDLNVSSDIYTAYAAYEGGKPTRVAICNLHLWNSTANRPSLNVSFTVPNTTKQLQVKRLTTDKGAYAISENAVTWGGQQWTYANSGLPVDMHNDTETIAVTGGKATVQVQSTEAVLAFLMDSGASSRLHGQARLLTWLLTILTCFFIV